MAWLAIVFAAALDIVANLLVAKSDGFRRPLLGVASLALVGLAFLALSVAVRTMDLSVAYALWGAFGILGTSLGGWLLFGQKVRPVAWLGMLLLIGGIVALNLSGGDLH